MPKASDLTPDDYLSFLLKSPPGFGKTIALGSFALEGPIFISYFDKKKPIELQSYFLQFGSIGRRILSNIEYEVYGASNANEYLNKLIEIAKDCRYFAIGTDSVTNLTSAAVNWSLGFNKTSKNKNKDRIIPDWDEYKVETSLVTQALDICTGLPCHVIWTAHPVTSTKIEATDSGIVSRVHKVVNIVTYGSKVAGITPGRFSEIYHFYQRSDWDSNAGESRIGYGFSTKSMGDDFAKSNIGLSGEYDITNKFFYSVWKEAARNHMEELKKKSLEDTLTDNQTY